MSQAAHMPPRTPWARRHPSLVLYAGLPLSLVVWVAFTFGIYFAFHAALGSQTTTPVAHAAARTQHVQVNLNIIINQPGMQQDWPAYAPNKLVVPANSLVTVTIRDYDLGDTPLPHGSPFTTVLGTVNGMAMVDGQPYASLAPEKVAHTFTIPQLHINVPLPGDAPKGARYDTVTFTFHTGKAGSYTFQCLDPCGTGSNGFEGPMVTRGYMIGTLSVQG
jgi:heme/copper-type cytochrome/quinol oxidase subunit 2